MELFVETFTVADFWLIIICLFLIMIDIVSGLIKAVVQQNIKSGKMWIGIMKKTAYIIIMAVALSVDLAQNFVDLGFTVPMLAAACVLIMLTEIASILENVRSINPELNTVPFFKLFNMDHEDTESDGAEDDA